MKIKSFVFFAIWANILTVGWMQSSVKGNVFLKEKIKLSLQESQQQAEV